MITQPVDITLTNPQITALLNADEAGGRITKSIVPVNVLRALHRRKLTTTETYPSRLTDDGREVVRQITRDHLRTTFTLLRPNGGRS